MRFGFGDCRAVAVFLVGFYVCCCSLSAGLIVRGGFLGFGV